MLAYQNLIGNYLQKHFKNHKLINTTHYCFDYVIEKQTLFVIDYFYLLNNSKFDEKFVKLFVSFEKDNAIMSYLKNTTLYFYHFLCEKVYFTSQSNNLLLHSIFCIFNNFKNKNVQNISFTKSFFNLLYIGKNREDIFNNLIQKINHLLGNKIDDKQFIHLLDLNTESSKNLFLHNYDFVSFEDKYKRTLNNININVNYNNLFVFYKLEDDTLSVVYKPKIFTKYFITKYAQQETLSDKIISFLNKKFNKQYDSIIIKKIFFINNDVFFDLYEMENNSLLMNLKEIEVADINFIALKEKIIFNEEIKNF